jgi:hypothetical protein
MAYNPLPPPELWALGARGDAADTAPTDTSSVVSLLKGMLTGSPRSATGGTVAVGSATSATTLKAGNTARKGLTIYNDSTAVLYVLLGAGTVSTSLFTVQMASESYYEVPFGFTGIVTGIWASVNGTAMVTELT